MRAGAPGAAQLDPRRPTKHQPVWPGVGVGGVLVGGGGGGWAGGWGALVVGVVGVG